MNLDGLLRLVSRRASKVYVEQKPANVTSQIAPEPAATIGETEVITPIEKGRRAAAKGDYLGAIKHFSEISPATFDSLYYRGCARLELRERNEICSAIDDFSRAIQLSSETHDPNVYYKRAFACQIVGRYTEAVIDYSTFMQQKKEDEHKGYLSRGLAYVDLKQYEKALDDIEKANETGPKPNIYYTYCLARIQAYVGHQKKAENKFKDLIGICISEHEHLRQTFDTHFYYGIASYELKDYSTALHQFNEALQCNPSNQQSVEIRFHIGLVQYALGKLDSAGVEFEKALERDEKHARALFRLGMVQGQNDTLQHQALSYLTKAHQLSPHRSDILYERGELYHKMGLLDASLRDKQLAFQLERKDENASAIKHYYELLLQKLLSTIKQVNLPKHIALMVTLMYDKIHCLSIDPSRSSIYDKGYHGMIKKYEGEIESNENGIYEPIYSILLCNLHKKHRRSGAAMIALDQSSDSLDNNPKLESYWQEMLRQVREIAGKQSILHSENIQNILQMINNQEASNLGSDNQFDPLMLSLLADRVAELEKIEKNRNQVKIDREYFKQDPNDSRRLFYDTMRRSLSHKFTAMAVTSGDNGSEPIVKHDRTGTESLIAEGVGILGDLLGTVMPVGGGIVSAVAGFTSSQLQNDEYNTFQDRMSFITDIGTVEELADTARQVARELANRYEVQLLSLTPKPNKGPSLCHRCGCFASCRHTNKATQSKVAHPAKDIARFAVSLIVNSVFDGEFASIELGINTESQDLVIAMVELLGRKKPSIKKVVLRRMNLDKSSILPHKPIGSTEQEEKLDRWYLEDFFYKPGIAFKDSNGQNINQKSVSWMNPATYGYRQGTSVEHEKLEERDKQKPETVSQNSCCC